MENATVAFEHARVHAYRRGRRNIIYIRRGVSTGRFPALVIATYVEIISRCFYVSEKTSVWPSFMYVFYTCIFVIGDRAKNDLVRRRNESIGIGSLVRQFRSSYTKYEIQGRARVRWPAKRRFYVSLVHYRPVTIAATLNRFVDAATTARNDDTNDRRTSGASREITQLEIPSRQLPFSLGSGRQKYTRAGGPARSRRRVRWSASKPKKRPFLFHFPVHRIVLPRTEQPLLPPSRLSVIRYGYLLILLINHAPYFWIRIFTIGA